MIVFLYRDLSLTKHTEVNKLNILITVVVLFAGEASGIRRNFNRRIINSFKKLESAIEGLNLKVDAIQNEITL